MSKVHSSIYTGGTSNVEQKMRDYIAAFNKNDLKLDFLFDDLYHHEFIGIHDGKKIGNKSELRQMHKAMLSKDTQARLVYFRKTGAFCYDMKLSFVNKERGEFTMRKLVAIEDDKIATSIDYNGTLECGCSAPISPISTKSIVCIDEAKK